MTTSYNIFLDVRRISDVRGSHQTEQRVVDAFCKVIYSWQYSKT